MGTQPEVEGDTRHLAELHPWVGVSRSHTGHGGSCGSRAVCPLSDCLLGDSGRGPSPETCDHTVTVTLGLSQALQGWTGWSVQMWFGALGVSVICQRRAGEVVKPEDPYPALRGFHPRMLAPPSPAPPRAPASPLTSAMRRY